MRWRGRRQSGNIDDRRRFGGGGRLALGGGAGGIILVILVVLLGGDPGAILQLLGGGDGGVLVPGGDAHVSPYGERSAGDDALADFVAVVLADTEDVWNQLFLDMGRTYREPTLVLFRGRVDSACGFASAAMGPFYCPADEKAYIDLSFYEELRQRFDAPGDFAQAYVLAHEIGHHVQNLLGISDQVHARRSQLSKEEFNALAVRLELQADFFAGVWAHHAQKLRNILEPGDVEEALAAASAIGDDRIQMQSQGYVVPESFTHGTARQRAAWFRKGLRTGDVRQGDTFNLPDP